MNNEIENDIKYKSIIDEYQRNKRIVKKIKFNKLEDQEKIWNAFLYTFKKTFKIKRQLEIGMEFNLKTGIVHSIYTLENLNNDQKKLEIKWSNNNDKYWLTFELKKKKFSKIFFLFVKEEIKKTTPFWGLQDVSGLFFLKRTFKKQMKNFGDSIKLVLSQKL